MYLKHLELLGFKSFAQKTTLDFPGGIASIVGPNGSGKSNIIDAVRWLLGEREAKNLRGMKAEDLIFAGTPKRPRMGMAQVTVTFDNSSGFFPVDYKEVTIQRRIERDGNSKYFLNKAEVRLKDIIDFFAKVRLGTRGLSIINQGSSDLFVRATPQERRMMIEEILGLRQYQLKKHEAERKLKNTGINIEKVKAMIEEIAPHLRFLKRQTSKWEKLADVEKELRECENSYFSNKLKELRDGLQKFDPQIKRIDQEISGKEKELKELRVLLDKVESGQPKQKSQMLEARKKREALLQERSNIEREASKLEAKIEFLHSVAASDNLDLRAGELLALLGEVKESVLKLLEEKNLEKIHQDLQSLLSKITSLTDTASKKKAEINDVKLAKDNLLKKLQPIREELDRLTKAEDESAKELEHFNEDFREAFDKVEKKKEEISVLDKEKNKLLFEVERLKLRQQDLEMQLSQINRNLKDFESLAENPPLVEDMVTLERRMLRLRSEIAGIGEVDQMLIKEAQETETRHNFLTTQLQDLEKAAGDLGALIKELEEKINTGFTDSLKKINDEFDKFFNLMFGGGKAKLFLEKPEVKIETAAEGVEPEEKEHEKELEEDSLSRQLGIEIDVSLPRKRIKGLEMLSGGEKSLVSIAALFALISVSPPPFLVLDEIDAALDEKNTRRFAEIIRDFSKKTQFIIVTHNRATMEAADVLYGVTMEEDGVSKVLSLKLE
ncbi:MAG: AAA family ATPase [Candidatus Harrisonbacteria bacterium]|nr:AAA family ATPase [Candidatus Harrisonbacteria bacterium]